MAASAQPYVQGLLVSEHDRLRDSLAPVCTTAEHWPKVSHSCYPDGACYFSLPKTSKNYKTHDNTAGGDILTGASANVEHFRGMAEVHEIRDIDLLQANTVLNGKLTFAS